MRYGAQFSLSNCVTPYRASGHIFGSSTNWILSKIMVFSSSYLFFALKKKSEQLVIKLNETCRMGCVSIVSSDN